MSRTQPLLIIAIATILATASAGAALADDGAAAATIAAAAPSGPTKAIPPDARPGDAPDGGDRRSARGSSDYNADLEELEPPPKAKDPRHGTAQDPDYQEAAEALHPLTPEQIEDLNVREEQFDQALASRTPPASSTASISVTARPGVPPSRILLSDDYVTALSILDSSGAPWPIARAQAGNGKLFRVEVPKDPGNVIIVTPVRKYASSNLIVLLKGAPVPISVALETTREAAYFNANLLVDERGPNALPPVFAPPPDPVDNTFMRSILDGAGAVTPGVRQVAISGAADTSAYYAGDKFYLRTRHMLQSPAAIASISTGGVRVYELTPSPVITVADENGRTIDLVPSDEALIEGALSANATRRPDPLTDRKHP